MPNSYTRAVCRATSDFLFYAVVLYADASLRQLKPLCLLKSCDLQISALVVTESSISDIPFCLVCSCMQPELYEEHYDQKVRQLDM